MAYTVISVFPANADTEEIKKDLQSQGIDSSNIIVSTSKMESESAIGDYTEDDDTRNFYDHLFVDDAEMSHAYRRESAGKTNVVVYADTIEAAQQAKNILYSKGAVEVKRKGSAENSENKDQAQTAAQEAGLPQDVYDGIIAKAKNNLYFLGTERTYRSANQGIEDTMDSTGRE